MSFDCDAFISYAHLDNVGLVEGSKGWITNLHRALEIRVGQLLGKPPHIWRDPKLQGNDAFADALATRLCQVALLVTIVSPRYIRSEWTKRELDAFCKAAEAEGGLKIDDRARIFKVLKTPTRVETHPPELRQVLGYEFFKIDPDTGRVRELDEAFGPDAQRDFWLKLDDLAHDICALLEKMEPSLSDHPSAGWPSREGIFLAEVAGEMREFREAMKRSLQQFGYRVLPDGTIPYTVADLETKIREDLAACQMSIHMVGRSYGFVPEGTNRSLLEIQNELAAKRSAQDPLFSRILWIPPQVTTEDERQTKFLEHIRHDPDMLPNSDLLETYFEELQTLVNERLIRQQTGKPVKASALPSEASTSPRIYIVYDDKDSDLICPWADYLFDQGFEVLHPQFDGDESEIRAINEENLCECDGVVLFFGSTNEGWLRRKLRDVQKSVGYGRTKALPPAAVCLFSARTSEKERFRTHDAVVISQFDGLNETLLQPFVSKLKV